MVFNLQVNLIFWPKDFLIVIYFLSNLIKNLIKLVKISRRYFESKRGYYGRES